MLQLRYTDPRVLEIVGACGSRASTDWAKATPATKASSSAVVGATGVRATAWDEGTGRVNWGPSAAGGQSPQPGGIIHKPPGGRQRRRCGNSKRRSDRTLEPAGSQGPLDPWKAVEAPAPLTAGTSREPTCWKCRPISGQRSAHEGGRGGNGFEAVLGKTRRTEF